ncbi:ATP-binding protein [Variovorax sp. J31P207]|uniref:ATP-binding protein n=1 Tax=Variovorax sp. J31P207 TaxID=3053510 RepID=UPI00257760D5|nr:ATP-binding protein [Variovorax sp. J31P207]MDM0065381.1 ATP-binding protein [Variovorax sp. J31P207]
MRVANLKIENFRGVRSGFVRFGKHPVIVGDNNTGKTTLIEALTLLLGRDRLVRELTEHDFFGSRPEPIDRIKLVATITDYPNDDPEHSSHWFREGRAVVKWLDEATGAVYPLRDNQAWKLCCQISSPESASVHTKSHLARGRTRAIREKLQAHRGCDLR